MVKGYSGADRALAYLFSHATEVSFTQIQTSGTPIGTITIDGVSATIYQQASVGNVKDVLVDGVSVVDANGDAQLNSADFVEANPVEPATDDLTTIKIGTTVYDIPGGGGSSKNYGKFTCDLLFVNDPLPSSTSGTTNVTRTYTLNKSIDDYDAVYVVIYNYYRSGQGATNITSRIVFKNDYYLKGFDNYSYYDGFTDPDRTRRINFTFTDSTHIQTLSFRNESDNEPILYKVYGLKFENQRIYLPTLYSEEEREVGVWTDGKPLYQKSITIHCSDYGAGSNTISHNISNVDKIFINHSATFFRDGNGNACPYIKGGYGNNAVYISGYDDKIFQSVNASSITLKQQNSNDVYGTITLQYTKTTDAPGSGTWTPEGQLAHHYSTSEKVVGTWIDGSTLYEKTQNGGISISANDTWYDTAFTGVDKVVSFNCSLLRDGEEIGSAFNNGHIDYVVRNNIVKIKGYNFSIGDHFTLDKLTIQYTKTSS